MINRREMLKQMLLITAAIPVLGMGIASAAPVETLQVKKLSALDNINHRRLLLKIKETLENVYLNFIEDNVYEPLDKITRHKLQWAMKEALDYYHASTRQVYDFAVICDESNNPPAVIDHSNLPVVDVWLKLTKSVQGYHLTIGPTINNSDVG